MLGGNRLSVNEAAFTHVRKRLDAPAATDSGTLATL